MVNPAKVFLKIISVKGTCVAAHQVGQEFDLNGVSTVNGSATCEEMAGEPLDVNTIAEPKKVAPKTTQFAVAGPKFTREVPAHSVSVIKVNAR